MIHKPNYFKKQCFLWSFLLTWSKYKGPKCPRSSTWQPSFIHCRNGNSHGLLLLTEPRWPLQPRGTQWFLRIGLFVVRAISLGPCRRPIEYLTSLHPCGRLSKIPNSQIHKVKKWKILSNFRRKDFFVISHERKDRFFVVIWPKKTPIHIKYLPRIDSTKVGHF